MTLFWVCRATIALLMLAFFNAGFVPGAEANPLYSYTDAAGTRVITDNYDKIPSAYRAKATVVEQETDGYAGVIERVSERGRSATEFVVSLPGMSFQQSKIITYAAIFGLLCLAAMNLSRSEGIRALALWCLVLTGICTPVLVYTADDGAAAVMKNKAAEIQRKQQDRLSHAQ
jgi:hypothetical protein